MLVAMWFCPISSSTGSFECCCFPDALERSGFNVWVDEIGQKAGIDFLNKIGQAIIDATVCCEFGEIIDHVPLAINSPL